MYSLLLFDGVFLVLDASEELVERVGEFLYAFVEQLLGDLVVMDADLLQGIEGGLCARDIILDAVASATVVTEVLDCLQWHGIDGIGSNQFFCIQYVPIGGIFGASAGP